MWFWIAVLLLGASAFPTRAAERPRAARPAPSVKAVSPSKPLASAKPIAAKAAPPEFTRDVLPVLKQHCFTCHSGATNLPKAGLRLDRKADLEALVDRAKPHESRLLARVKDPASSSRMPPEGFGRALNERELNVLRGWLRAGAPMGAWTEARHDRYEDYQPAPKQPVDLDQAARRIDELVEARLKTASQKPNAAIDDATFLRRLYLQTIGRIPTAVEAGQFLQSKDPQRRAKLIDSLIGSEGYVSRQFNLWADALRAKSDLDYGRSGDLYLWWIKDSIRKNVPYDEFVRRLLLAKGSLWEDPAVSYYFRDSSNRLATVESTASVFLGTNIGCAQCHNDPYDKWTRKDYWQLAAFFEAASPYFPREQTFRHIKWDEVEKQRNDLSAENARLRRSWDHPEADRATTAWTSNQKLLGRIVRVDRYYPSLPHDYQYGDAKPKSAIQPQVLFGAKREAPNNGQAIDILADWLTSPKNPRFTLTIVNRMWALAMGAPLAGKVTDIAPIDECSNPELARSLVQTLIDLDYDLQAFQRILLRTQTWQRAPYEGEIATHLPYYFPGPVLRRMSAEQAWDSLMTLIVPDVDRAGQQKKPDYSAYARLQDARSTEEYWKIIDEMIASGQGYLAGFKRSQALRHETRAVGFRKEELVRASELPAPSFDGHFLRQFGQSDREIIDASWANPTTPQALTMLNGPLFQLISADDSLLGKQMVEAAPREQVRRVYLALLSREPSAAETDLVLQKLGSDGPHMWKSLAWALLNTRQFLFVN